MTENPRLKTSFSLQRPTNQRGQTLVEYALILAFISVVAIGSMIAMGGQVKSAFTTINSQLATAQNGGGSPAGTGTGTSHSGG